MDRPEYELLAQIAVDEVSPSRQGFTLTGQGRDHADYHMDLRFEMPLDVRTRAVLGELLAHSDLTISRRPPQGLANALRQRRAARGRGRTRSQPLSFERGERTSAWLGQDSVR